MKITMLAYPGMTPLDLMGPLQTWTFWPGAEVQVVWKHTDPIMTDTGMAVVPTHSFATSFEQPEIVFVPGGTKATFELTQDEETLELSSHKGQNGHLGNERMYRCTGDWRCGFTERLQGHDTLGSKGPVVWIRRRGYGWALCH